MTANVNRKGFAVTLGLVLLLAVGLAAQAVPANLYSALHWRLVGPFRGGRVEAVAGIPGNPNVYYFGAVGGGVWKTANGGLSWQPVFDHEPTQSIGAIAIDPQNPSVVYVGTGEPALRDDIDFGDGVYKSVDGGRTWTHLGLTDTRHIAAIVINPLNPQELFVAALGDAHNANPERGVFRSTDGGHTWTKVLYVNAETGANDISMDPHNPNVLFAAMYQVRRLPWDMISGGPGSGLYKSTDGGSTWRQLQGHGLPGGILGRIGVSVSPADPQRVYAMIEAKKNAIYASRDGGQTWTMVNDNSIWVRPWYGNRIFADPKSPNTVYVLDLEAYRSTDGGKHFSRLPGLHSDEHALWIDPLNPARMIEGNDGGATISTNDGASWSTQENQPTGEFYTVSTDSEFNYRIYGSQQDDGSVAIRSRTDHGSIGRQDWYSVGGGESGYVLPMPNDPDIVYASDHAGHITRWDGHTGQEQNIAPWFGDRAWPPTHVRYRFNWSPPMALSPFNPHVMYVGAQVVFKSTDGGMSWTVISPDLTRNDKSKQVSSPSPLTPDNSSAEYYDTLFTIAPSPRKQGEIWVGSDDGLVHLTLDGGAHWSNVTPPDLPAWTRVNLIEPSPFAAGTAYVAADKHMLGDFQPLIFKTTDYGKTWTKLVQGIPSRAYVHSVIVDPEHRGLLFAATQRGPYVSFNDGANWQSLQLNLPAVAVYDLTIHGDDLIASTHGRAFWVLDDISPLRQITPDTAAAAVHLFQPAAAYREHRGGFFGGSSSGAHSPQPGMRIDYYLQQAPSEPISLSIFGPQGHLIQTFKSGHGRFSLPAKPGLNRFIWNLRGQSWTQPEGVFVLETHRGGGPLVLPGAYRIELSANGQTYRTAGKVELDPRVHVSQADLVKQYQLAVKLRDRVDQLNAVVAQIRQAQQALDLVRQLRPGLSPDIDALQGHINSVLDQLVEVHSTSLGAALVFPIKMVARYAQLFNVVESADAAPPAQVYSRLQGYEQQRTQLFAQWNTLRAQVKSMEAKLASKP